MKPETVIIIVLISLAVLLFLLFMTAYVSYLLTFRGRSRDKDDPYAEVKLPAFKQYQPRIHELIGKLEKTPCEHVYIKSHDGLRLHARYYNEADGAPVEIQMHGYKGHPMRDFCSGARDAHDRRHNLLLVDQRAHGKSEGKSISFGINESIDCKSWIEYAIDRFGSEVQIYLIGMSMGAATVLMASGLDLPENVSGILADCPYSSPRNIIRRVIGEDMGLPVWLLYPFVRLGGIIFGGFDIESASPVEAVKSSKIPTLIIHGSADSFVPASMSEEIFANCTMQKKKRLQIEGADHGLSYFVDKDLYLGAVNEMLNVNTDGSQ